MKKFIDNWITSRTINAIMFYMNYNETCVGGEYDKLVDILDMLRRKLK